MKFAIILASICCALLLGGCADQSLMTDEEYVARRGPAPNAPDYSQVIPQSEATYSGPPRH